jgi:hypothetical protein
MGDFVGVTAFSVPNLAAIKQQALLFDRIAVPGLSSVVEDAVFLEEQESAELCWLGEQGLVIEATIPATESQVEELKRVEGLLAAEPNYFTRFVAEQLRAEFSIDAVALESNIPLKKRQYIFSPFRDESYLVNARCLSAVDFPWPDLEEVSELDSTTKALAETVDALRPQLFLQPQPERKLLPSGPNNTGRVVDIVLGRFPYIDDGTPWERVFEFRNDTDAKAKRNALRKWMSTLATKPCNQVEIEQEIDYLLSAYEEHMRVHEMTISRGSLRTVVVGAATVLEDLVKIKWGKIAESLFSLSDRKTTLMKEELKAPGRELSYLLAIQKDFPATG